MTRPGLKFDAHSCRRHPTKTGPQNPGRARQKASENPSSGALGGLEMETNTNARGCPDFGVGANISATLEARILPPSPRSGSSSLGGGTPPTL
eukprot:2185534-Pyramimonas_sp.AAC.1